MASYTATVVEEGSEKVVRLPGSVPLAPGYVSYTIGETGTVILESVKPSDKQRAWIAFLDHLDNTPRDPDFMIERPMNRPPVERNLFPDD